MNTSLKKIAETSDNEKILSNSAKLMAWSNKKVAVEFIKKDGSVRKMICSLCTNWNTLNGLGITKSGLKMLNTKIHNGMATVIEYLGCGGFQVRTLNLGKITKMELV